MNADDLAGVVVPDGVEDAPPAPIRLTVEEMFRRVRARSKITRGRFKGELKRAIRRGEVRVVPGEGVMLELTDLGALAMGDELRETVETVG